MKFQKGQKKTGGRKKGVGNKDKRAIRMAIDKLLDNVDIVELYEKQKTEKDKAALLLGLAEYSIPKLSRTESTNEHIFNPFEFEGINYNKNAPGNNKS